MAEGSREGVPGGGRRRGTVARKPKGGRSAESQAREVVRKAEFAQKARFDRADIGPIPPCKDPELREEVSRDLVAWHTKLFPNTTGLKPLGEVQIKSSQVSQQVIIHGGRTQKLEPRGYGKTTRSQQEAMWAVFHGYRHFPVVIGSSKEKAAEILGDIKRMLMGNTLLQDLYPEICYPFYKLGGKAINADYQHSQGQFTKLKWEKDRIVLPVVYRNGKPVATSNAIIGVKSITNARGMKQGIFNGEVRRPDMMFLDDLQTFEDAINKDRVRKLLLLLRKDIFRLGGHSKSMAVLKCATIIDADDVPDTLTRDKSFQTVRYKMVIKMPDNMKIWLGQYAEILKDYDSNDPNGQVNAKRKARDFYLERQEEMDRGAELSWEWAYEWKEDLEVSALQHAMNILIADGQDAFNSECQNMPIRADDNKERVKATRAELKAAVAEGIERGKVPIETNRNYAFIDPQKEILYWAAGAVKSNGMNSHVFEYGTYPKQASLYFYHTRPNTPISEVYPNVDWVSAVYLAVEELVTELVEREWSYQGGDDRVKLDRIFIDVNMAECEEQLVALCRDHRHAGLLVPYKGRPIKARSKTLLEEWKQEPGDERGLNWIKRRREKRGVKILYGAADFWKTQVHRSIRAPGPTPGSMSFFAGSDHQHELFFDHLLSENESLESSSKTGRTQHEWTQPPGAQNHWLDCLAGILVGASSEGCTFEDQPEPRKRKVRRIRYADRRTV